MVDDRTQRPFGSNEPARAAAAKPSGNDPLAELARLIGQNDPFGEFGRDGARRASAPPAHEPPPSWVDEPASQQAAAPAPPTSAPGNYYAAPQAAPPVLPPNFGRQTFGGAPLGHDTDLYQVETTVPGYSPQPAAGYAQHAAYDQSAPHLGPEEDDFYEDEQPSRRRMGVLVIAGVFALAVIGTAGAFGYRALFGSSSVSGPPPVIKAESAPSKVVPASTGSQSNKQITDRINDKGLGEKLVSREEQPVAIMPQDPPPPSSMPAAAPSSQGNGVVGTDPKKVRTIAIRPDQGTSDPAPQAAAPPPPSPPQPAAAPTPVRVIPTARPAQPQQPARAANNPPPAADTAEAEPAPAPRQAAAPRSANAPLSLSPNAPAARAAAPAAPSRTASLPPAASGGGSYLVQVSSQRSEAEAQTAFQSLQSKFPSQLGGKQAVIRKVELGEKGTYYRAMVPAGDAAEANQMCSGMKAAGGSCLVQKN
jgi:sporulation related protein